MLRYKCDNILTETGIFDGYVYVDNGILRKKQEEFPYRLQQNAPWKERCCVLLKNG